MATTADFRNGMVIEYNNDLYTIVQFQHVKPGKGPAFVRTRLKNVTPVERRPDQYLYKDDMGYHLMQVETFEQIPVPESMLENSDLLKEGDIVEVVVHADTENVLLVDLPVNVVMEVTYSEPGLRGDTATNTLKPATIETGSTIMVPLFVNVGDKIRIDTRDRSYIERVKG
jgi:elongation factor P